MPVDNVSHHAHSIRIRPMISTDAFTICQIWCDGLNQTSQSCQWNMSKHIVGHMMTKLKDHATSEEGDVGPNGANLAIRWMDKSDRVMLVAEYDEIASKEQRVVGCCGVKIGTHESKHGPESDVGSVWRVSVDPSARNLGVGKVLMAEAERWISDSSNGRCCTKMQLVTGNRIAAQFYKTLGYEKINWILHALDLPGWYEKTLHTTE